MILEATGNRPGSLKPIEFKYPRDVDLLAYIIVAILIGHHWLTRTWPLAQAKTEVYLLTRLDLLRRQLVLWPIGVVFLLFVAFFLWLHWSHNWSHNAGPFLVEKAGGFSFPCPA